MKTALMMNFNVDKDNKKIKVEREFAAPISKVWPAWTRSDLLDQWWAPKPWKAETKQMDFRTGGHWLYAMVGPEGEKHWSFANYKKVEPEKSFTGLDGFCDENGKINQEFPQSQWDVSFKGHADSTVVNITITYESLAALEAIIKMGFKEGFTMGMENLDELLAK